MLRVATIGAGYFSQFHHDAWARMSDVQLVAVCDSDKAKADAVGRRYGAPRHYTDAAAMLDEERPDLLDIITPSDSHLALIRLAAARGIDTICQKAFCRTIEEARMAVDAADQAGIRLVVHENFRFQPWYRAIKGRIGQGDLGEVYQVTFRLRPGDGQGPRAYLERQPYFQTMERFLVHETAIHFIDTFRYLLGDYRSVFADLRKLNPVIAGEDSGIILFEHKSGARALFDGNRLVDHRAADKRLTMGEMLVEGSQAVLRLDGDGHVYRRAVNTNDETEIFAGGHKSGYRGDAVLGLQRHVVDAIRRGTPLENTARDYLHCLEVELAVYRSAAARAVEST